MKAERAVIFGRDAETYDRYRPSYPLDAIAHVRSLVTPERALEIGAGTGKATVAMADGTVAITCLEPSPGMAHGLIAKNLPGVEVVQSTFEEFHTKADSADLVYAAQAWHWVDHATAYKRVLEILRPGGAIALMWNVLQDRYTHFEHHYRRHAPQLVTEMDERIHKRDHYTWSEDLKATGFECVERWTHRWSTRLGATQYVGLCASYSDHMLLPVETRERLLAAIADEIGDGEVILDYRTEVFSGHAPHA